MQTTDTGKKKSLRSPRRSAPSPGFLSSLHPVRAVRTEPPAQASEGGASRTQQLGRALLKARQDLDEARRSERRARAEMQGLQREKLELEQSLQANRSLVVRFLRERQNPPPSPRELELEAVCEELRLQMMAYEHERMVTGLELESLRAQLLQARCEVEQGRVAERSSQDMMCQQQQQHEFMMDDLQTELVRLQGECERMETCLRQSFARLEQLVDTQDNLLMALDESRLENRRLHQRLRCLEV